MTEKKHFSKIEEFDHWSDNDLENEKRPSPGSLVLCGYVEYSMNSTYKKHLYTAREMRRDRDYKLMPGKRYCTYSEYENCIALITKSGIVIGWFDPEDNFNPKEEGSCLTKGKRYDINELLEWAEENLN